MSDSPISVSDDRPATEAFPEMKAIRARLEDYLFNEDRDGDYEEDADQFATDIATLLHFITTPAADRPVEGYTGPRWDDPSGGDVADIGENEEDAAVENSELPELLDAWAKANREDRSVDFQPNIGAKEAQRIARNLRDARSRIEELFASLQLEAERRFQSMMEAHKANGELAKQWADREDELTRLVAEISRLRADRPPLQEIRPEMEQAIVDLERALTAPPVSDFHDQNVRSAARNALRSRIGEWQGLHLTPEEARMALSCMEGTNVTFSAPNLRRKLARISEEGNPK